MKAKIRLIDEVKKAELIAALKAESNVKMRTKLQSVELAYTGEHTLTEIAVLVRRARSGVAEYIRRFRTGGVDALRPKARKGPPAERKAEANDTVETMHASVEFLSAQSVTAPVDG